MPDFLRLELPSHLPTEKFLVQLTEKRTVDRVSHILAQKTYYDSFDWRLYSADIICELKTSQTASEIRLLDACSDAILAKVEAKSPHKNPTEFKSPVIQKLILPLLDIRVLLPVASYSFTLHKLNILNKYGKTVVRLAIESFGCIPDRVVLESIKGYEKVMRKVSKDLVEMGLTESDETLLVSLLKTQGRIPNDYSSKLNIRLDPDMRSDTATKHIYQYLLKTMKINWQGVIDDTDSEFLHDFRIAVRRTRSGLNQLKQALPLEDMPGFVSYFKWLGQITNQTRDLDVYLLKFDEYKQELPITIREDLNPLYDFLQQKKQVAQKELAFEFNSDKFHHGLDEWETYLKRLPEYSYDKPINTKAQWPIKCLADFKIWKVFRQIITHGQRISTQSAAEELHQLRKTCKKLRYLMEFFKNLYPEKEIMPLIKSLKKFQEILGEFQDLAIQEQCLRDFSVEMMEGKFPPRTLLAMGVLIQQLDKRRKKCREVFASHFNEFEQDDNQTAFHALFNP